jgi:hypothetical protein
MASSTGLNHRIPLLSGTVTDLVRSQSELVAENALLRKPLMILRRHVKRPACTTTDRALLVLLARMGRTWKQALVIVQPETLLRWHRLGCAPVLEVHIQSGCPQTKDSCRIRSLDQGHDGAKSVSCERNGSVANGSNWVCASVNARSRRTCDTCARLDHMGGPGQPSCALMLSRSGPVTFSRSPTCFSVRSLLSSSSNYARAK